MNKNDPKQKILDAAVEISRTKGYNRITRNEVAEQAGGIAGSSVHYHFKTMTKLRRDIMRAAVRNEVIEVVAQGLALRDPHALKAPLELRGQAVDFMLSQE